MSGRSCKKRGGELHESNRRRKRIFQRTVQGQQIEARRGTRWLQFVGENTRLDCRLTESVPLDLDQTVPTRFREEFYVCPDEFLRELNYLKNLLPPKAPPLVRFDGGVLSLGKWPGCRTRIVVDLAEGRSCTIPFGFDLSYMLDAIGQFEGVPSVKMKISGSFGPVVLEAEGRSDFALMMPVRLQEQRAAA